MLAVQALLRGFPAFAGGKIKLGFQARNEVRAKHELSNEVSQLIGVYRIYSELEPYVIFILLNQIDAKTGKYSIIGMPTYLSSSY